MGNRFSIEILAVDKATAVFRKINNQMSQTMQPITRAQRQFVALSREMHLDKITKGMSNLSHAGEKVASSLGLATGPMEALFGLGAAGGIIAATTAVVALGARFGKMGFEVDRSATSIGLSTRQLQLYRGAAKLADVSSETMDATLQGLGKTLQDSFYKRDPEARAVMEHFGITMRQLADGTPDVKSGIDGVADAMKSIGNPYTRRVLADALHIPPDAIPALMLGAAAFNALGDKAEKLGLVLGPKQIQDAKDYAVAMRELDGSVSGLANSLGSKLAPALTRALTSLQGGMNEGGFSGAMWKVFSGQASWQAAFGSSNKRSDSGVVTGAPALAAAGAGPVGMRGNNPGNLRDLRGGFQSFADSQDGLNAMAAQIWRYQHDPKWGVRSLRDIVSTYAPPSENNTGAYLSDVSARTGLAADSVPDTGDPKVLAPLLSAMVRHEQGKQPFSDQQLSQAAQTAASVHVTFANAPPGMRVRTDPAGAFVPTRVSYAVPTTETP